MRLIWAVDHGLQRTSKRMVRTLGVTGPQRLVVRVVGRHPGVSAGELARILHVHPSTLTGVLARLARRRMLTRRSDPRDGRRARLFLSDRGLALDADAPGTVERAARRALRTLGPARRRAAEQALRLLAAELGVSGRPEPAARP
jgi:DNA-binding MarR family transcriptional regulator